MAILIRPANNQRESGFYNLMIKGLIDFLLAKIYPWFLSPKVKHQAERVILYVAIASFLLHLALIGAVEWGWLRLPGPSHLLHDPVAAIYTPFSFILVYEVYLLVYYLPRSITTYVAKQYEIVTLIVIRRLFKDLSYLELSSDWFKIQDDLNFSFDLVASLLLFLLIFWFYRSIPKRSAATVPGDAEGKLGRFIALKKVLALVLVPTLLLLASWRFGQWIFATFADQAAGLEFKNLNNIFFDEFFTLLIVVDVLVLLFSFFHSDRFYTVIRNSGFVISTILIRLSFSTEGLINTLLLLTAVLFGLLILRVHRAYFLAEEQDKREA